MQPLRAMRLHQLPVARDVDGGLAKPPDVQRDQGPEELFGFRDVHEDVVVHEEDVLAARALDLVHDNLDRALAEVRAVESPDRAELAVVPAAPPVLHKPHREVALPLEDRAVGHGSVDRGEPIAFVNGLQPVRSRVGDHAGPHTLRIAPDDRVGNPQRLLWRQGRVIPAHDDPHPATSVLLGDLVRLSRRVGLDGECREVGGLVVGNRLQTLIVELRLDPRRRQVLEDGERERFHGIGRPRVLQIRSDEGDPHGRPR